MKKKTTNRIIIYVVEIRKVEHNINSVNDNIAKLQVKLQINKEKLNRVINAPSIAIGYIINIRNIEYRISSLRVDIAKLQAELQINKENLNNILDNMID